MRYIINGAAGRMGKVLLETLGDEVIYAADLRGGYRPLSEYMGPADCIIDFSSHQSTGELLDYAVKRNIPAVIATTGHDADERALIREASKKIPVFYSANMSIGICAVCGIARKLASLYKDADIEIIETHHNKKQDSPSGTALLIANEIVEERGDGRIVAGRNGFERREKGDIGISSARMGGIVGEHEVVVCTESERITVKHEAFSRKVFAEGAIKAAKFIADRAPGIYSMKDLLK